MSIHEPNPVAWQAPDGRVVAEDGIIHLWRVRLDVAPEVVVERRRWCTEAEQARADRYVFDHLARRFLAGRGALRAVSGGYLGIAPWEVRFHEGPRGKLYLGPALDGELLQVNLSNSGDLALIAVTPGPQVGVDLEQHRELTWGEEVARRHFAPGELARLPRARGPAWTQAFYNTWTRKEAFIKLTGEGLGRALDSFEVAVLPEEEVRLLRVDDDHAPHQRFTLMGVDIDPGFTAALAVAGPPRPVRRLAFPDGLLGLR